MEAKKDTPIYKHVIYGVLVLCFVAVLSPVLLIVLPIYFYFDYKKAKLKINTIESPFGSLLKSFFTKDSKKPILKSEINQENEPYKFDSLEKMLKAKKLEKL